MTAILDACALLAFLRKESGSEIVMSLLMDPETLCLAHAVNLCEVYYNLSRMSGEIEALRFLDEISELGVFVRDDMDRTLWTRVGQFKRVAGSRWPIASPWLWLSASAARW